MKLLKMAGFVNPDNDKTIFSVVFEHINTAGVLPNLPESFITQVKRREKKYF